MKDNIIYFGEASVRLAIRRAHEQTMNEEVKRHNDRVIKAWRERREILRRGR